MLTIRTGHSSSHGDQLAMANIAAAITEHSLAARLHGTVLVGTGGAQLIRARDARPRVLVAIPGGRGTNSLARAQIAAVDGVVVRDAIDASRLATAIGSSVVVTAAGGGREGGPPFLVGADAAESASAWMAVAQNHDLYSALRAIRGETSRDDAGAIADAVIEAIVACSPDGEEPFRTGTRG